MRRLIFVLSFQTSDEAVSDLSSLSDESGEQKSYEDQIAQAVIAKVCSNRASLQQFLLWGFANNKGADQPTHLRRLISAFVIHLLESMISKLASSKISIF